MSADKNYWIPIGINFFEEKKMIELQSLKDGYLYSDILIKMYLKTMNTNLEFKANKMFGINETISILTRHKLGVVNNAISIFKKMGLAEILDDNTIKFIKVTKKRDRSNFAYKMWRISVFERDAYKCCSCGEVGKKLNAHHIVRWADDIDLRYEIDNGITLCEQCHKLAHKGVK